MRIKKGFVLREVCGERVIMGEGLGAINFGKLLALNETAAWLWEYEVTADEAKADVAEIIADWQKVDVVE